jgi:hypothetical protein
MLLPVTPQSLLPTALTDSKPLNTRGLMRAQHLPTTDHITPRQHHTILYVPPRHLTQAWTTVRPVLDVTSLH